jgi:geranylgeranyl pyrophosphate synthase
VDAQLPLLLEGVICVQYYENQILDGKGGVLKSGQPDLQKIRSNLLASHYLKDFLYQYAAKSVFAHDGSRREVLVDALRKMFQFVDMGQYMEQRWGRYEVFRDGLHEALPEMSQEVVAFWDQALISEFQARIMAAGVPAFKDKFLRCYLQRAYLTNAALFVLAAELLMDLLGYQGPSRAALKRYAGHFGLMAQLSNDINDFLPASFGQKTLAKDAEDAQGDLRNGNMTLPMILHFSEYPGDTPTQLLQMPQKKIALRLKNAIWHKAVPLVKELAQELGQGLSPENPRTSLLQDFGSIALGGRYLDDFKKLFEDT